VLDDDYHIKECGNCNPRSDNKSMKRVRTSGEAFKTSSGMPNRMRYFLATDELFSFVEKRLHVSLGFASEE
jgi:hypothetical protein